MVDSGRDLGLVLVVAADDQWGFHARARVLHPTEPAVGDHQVEVGQQVAMGQERRDPGIARNRDSHR